MRPVERLSAAIRSPRHAGKPALMPYVTMGFPRREGTVERLRAIASVADAIEIGVPFSDPMADGATLQQSSRVALENGVSVRWILDTLREANLLVPFVLMSYFNPLLRYGLERLVRDAAASGASGFIVPDLPWEEGTELRTLARAEGLGVVQLVTPVTPPGRLELLCRESDGFVYAVTVTGITGTSALPPSLTAYLDAARGVSPVPVCAGFGIRAAEQVRWLTGHADGVVVGSALVDALSRGEDPVAFLSGLMR